VNPCNRNTAGQAATRRQYIVNRVLCIDKQPKLFLTIRLGNLLEYATKVNQIQQHIALNLKMAQAVEIRH